MAEEATINPDGSTNFAEEPPPVGDDVPPMDEEPPMFEEKVPEGIDPAIYVVIAVILAGILYYIFVYRKKSATGQDAFFANLDGDKFNLKLPAEVDEYYAIKEKCEAAGWKPGQGGGGNNAQNQQPVNAPARMLAQALMKRAIADIPIVTHIQKESAGMNKLYSQSMCSVNQWKSYQYAEAMVSSEVQDVRAEADEIEPGWSQAIWRQAMQYHNMLKQKHEAEAKQQAEHAKKRKEIEARVKAAQLAQAADPDAQARAAEKAAQELIKAEERDKQSKAAFKQGMKKGFLDSNTNTNNNSGGNGGAGKKKGKVKKKK